MCCALCSWLSAGFCTVMSSSAGVQFLLFYALHLHRDWLLKYGIKKWSHIFSMAYLRFLFCFYLHDLTTITLGEERLIFVPLEERGMMAGTALAVSSHHLTFPQNRKQKTGNPGSAGFSIVTHSGSRTHGLAPPIIRVTLPSWVIALWKTLHRHSRDVLLRRF